MGAICICITGALAFCCAKNDGQPRRHVSFSESADSDSNRDDLTEKVVAPSPARQALAPTPAPLAPAWRPLPVYRQPWMNPFTGGNPQIYTLLPQVAPEDYVNGSLDSGQANYALPGMLPFGSSQPALPSFATVASQGGL